MEVRNIENVVDAVLGIDKCIIIYYELKRNVWLSIKEADAVFGIRK